MNRNHVVIAALCLVLAIMVWTGYRQSYRDGSALGPGLIGSVGGKTAPDFRLTDVRTGRTVSLSSFRGKAVLLNFWATWCPPCKVEIPWFVDLQKRYGPQGLVVVGVAMDDSGSAAIARFADEMKINYPILQGTEAVATAYGNVEALPTTFYISRNGQIVERVFGMVSHSDAEDSIKFALSEGQSMAESVSAGASKR